jgi:hypothetical protein
LLNVSRLVGASPENTLLMLTPPSASRPRPVEIRFSTSAASRGRFVTTSRRVSFSYQRNAGTWVASPCMMPAWLAGVVAGMPVCQPTIVCVPVRTQRPRFGRFPALTAQLSRGSLSPSS